MKSATDVNSYIANAPPSLQAKLKQMRATILASAPNAREKISYGMPYYEHNGRLAYFAFFKKHIGLYIPTPTIEHYQQELKQYQTAKATIRFPVEEPLPVALIKKLITARVHWNNIVAKEKLKHRSGR